ncbi:hypothetical protein C2E19_18575 [Pseudomonas sp. DTU12.3]|nr:hypothetical protein C2E19_18575 [Pseudomonas sp. DTU12.3]
MGASLLANAVGQSPRVQAGTTLSRAGSLPQGFVALGSSLAQHMPHVGAAAGCDPLILLLNLKKQNQKIAACGSSYRGGFVFRGQKKRPEPVGASVLRLCG